MNADESLPTLSAGPEIQSALDVLAGSLWKGLQDAEFACPVPPDSLHGELMGKRAAVVRIERVAYAEDDESGMLSLLGALATTGATGALIATGHPQGATLHLGASHDDRATMHAGSKVLRASLDGHFPGTQYVPEEDLAALLTGRTWDEYGAVAALTGIPSNRSEGVGRIVNGIDRFLNAMRGRRYTLMLLADPLPDGILGQATAGYAQLATALSPLAERRFNLSHNASTQRTESEQHSVATSFAHTVGDTLTNGTSTTTGSSRPAGGGILLGLALAAAGVALAVPTGGISLAAAAGGMGLGMAIGGSKNKSKSASTSDAHSTSDTDTRTQTQGVSTSEAVTRGTSQGMDITIRDRSVSLAQEMIERHLERLRAGRRHGFWNLGIYLAAQSPEDARVGASVLRGIMRGEDSDLEPSTLTVWERGRDPKAFIAVRRSLQYLEHPKLHSNHPVVIAKGGKHLVTPTSMVTSAELGVVMGLPRSSVPGLPVLRHAPFGRQVSRGRAQSATSQVELGDVQYLGALVPSSPVVLDLRSLGMHTFVTGTTGSGKTNVVLHLLEQLYMSQPPVPFLVIEPAKQEYLRLLHLRGRAAVHRLGTTQGTGQPLRFNPLAFPSGTHLLQHLDRLLEVFNAAFPLYAAMPALLEEAMRAAYEAKNWNLSSSRCRGATPTFPTLQDLAESVEAAVVAAGYSVEVTANYRAALVTRIRSLTRGIKGEVLCPLPGEITPDGTLFDENCVLNIAGLGSSDTRALVMGMLLVRLREHREQQSDDSLGGETRLSHLVVLEEAHHLLKRTSTNVSQDSSNLTGMAVEGIASAIAEMRALGQGFLIVDQSPGSLDPSVIRNTNTKLVLRTPHHEDRELVGRAINATPEQIDELGRLGTGVGAVFQNDWLEPVLAQFRQTTLPVGPPGLARASGSGVDRWRCLILIALPGLVGVQRAAAAADALLASGPHRLADVPLAIATLLGEPGSLAALRDIWGDGTDMAYGALRKRWAPRVTEGTDVGVVVAHLTARFALSPAVVRDLLRSPPMDDVGLVDRFQLYFS